MNGAVVGIRDVRVAELSNAGAEPVMQAFSVTFPGKIPPSVL